MTFAKLGTTAVLIITLTGAASAMPLTAPERPAARLENVQWGGHGWGHGGRGHHHGWRHHHRPRCWMERVVHRTQWGPRVDYRRVCR
jgi:hypothetical protein